MLKKMLMTIAPALLAASATALHVQGDAPAAAAGRAQVVADLDAHFREREKRGFHGVVLIVEKGDTLLETAYGRRDPQRSAPMAGDTVFDIGSIVKPITVVALFKLEAEGKLRTSDPLSTFFDDVPEDKAAITLEQIMTHSAGLPNVFGGDYDLITREELRRLMFEAPLLNAPGERSRYSNSGFSLLAMIIEDVSGLPYEEYVHEALIKPAGSQRIGYVVPHWPHDTLAVGVRGNRRFGTPLEHAWYGDGPSWHLRGNGGMLSNARDLHDFFIALESNAEVLPEAARKRWIARAGSGENGEPRGYGFAGGNPYFNAIIGRNVDDDLTIVAMSNDGEHRVEESTDELLKLFKP